MRENLFKPLDGIRALWMLSLVLACLQQANAAQPILDVAVAANFAGPIKRIAQRFEQETGVHLQYSLGATGLLKSQIEQGAPYEVFLAADQKTPQTLVAMKEAVGSSEWTYAQGHLLLWSLQPGKVDAQGRVLETRTYRHLAIANPQTAPYGAAAMQVLHHLHLYEKVQQLIIEGNSIGQTWQFVRSGNAELGFIAQSQLTNPGESELGSNWKVPQSLYDPIRQDAVILQRGAHDPNAVLFMRFLQRADMRQLVKSYGYGP